jgi:hypothetical protein
MSAVRTEHSTFCCNRPTPGAGVMFDRPHVVAEIARTRISERTTVAGGDFFESVPPADLYLLNSSCIDWDDDSAATILRRCLEVMEPGGQVVIIEMIVGDLSDPGQQATLMDLGMLAVLNGRQRSLREYNALLETAGHGAPPCNAPPARKVSSRPSLPRRPHTENAPITDGFTRPSQRCGFESTQSPDDATPSPYATTIRATFRRPGLRVRARSLWARTTLLLLLR